MYSIYIVAGKVKTTAEIYKHKMQVNDGSTAQPESPSLTPVKEGEGVIDVPTTAVPAMPSLDQTQDESLQQQEEQVPGAEGGEGETEEGEGEEKVADEDGGGKSGGEEETSLPQEQS